MGSRFKTLAVAGALLLALSACQQPASKSAEAPSASTPAAGDAATPAVASAATGAGIPAECQAYLDTMQSCIDHMSTANPAVAAQFRAQMEQTRARWASIQDQATLATGCATATNIIRRSLRSMGC